MGYRNMKLKKIQKKANIYKVQTLDKALDILDCFSFQKRELSLTEICQLIGLNKTTAKRLVFTLTSRDYLRQAIESKRYQLGLRMFELGGIVFSSFSLLKAANHPMSQLRNLTECTSLLGVVMDDQLVYVDKRDGPGMIRISSDIGWRKPLHFGMLGMVLMAYLTSEKVNDILEKYPLTAHTRYSITDQHAFSLRLEKIRKEGCVIECEEAVEGLIGIAAPIRDYSRQVVAALGVSLPKGQADLERKSQETVGLVKRTCDEISSNLGYLRI